MCVLWSCHLVESDLPALFTLFALLAPIARLAPPRQEELQSTLKTPLILSFHHQHLKGAWYTQRFSLGIG